MQRSRSSHLSQLAFPAVLVIGSTFMVADSIAQTAVWTPTAPGTKSGVGATSTISFPAGTVTVTYVVTYPAMGAPPAPVALPTFNIEYQDDDGDGGDDCDDPPKDIPTPGVGGAAAWVLSGNVRVPPFQPLMSANDYVYTWTPIPAFSEAADIDPCDDNTFLYNNNGDPEINLFVAVPTIGNAGGNVLAPDVPMLGPSDIGVIGPSKLANSTALIGFDVTAMSRGYDEISGLSSVPGSSGPSLYFTTDSSTQTLPSGYESELHAGSAFVLDFRGDAWLDSAFFAASPPPGIPTPYIRFLNVNTG